MRVQKLRPFLERFKLSFPLAKRLQNQCSYLKWCAILQVRRASLSWPPVPICVGYGEGFRVETSRTALATWPRTPWPGHSRLAGASSPDLLLHPLRESRVWMYRSPESWVGKSVNSGTGHVTSIKISIKSGHLLMHFKAQSFTWLAHWQYLMYTGAYFVTHSLMAEGEIDFWLRIFSGLYCSRQNMESIHTRYNKRIHILKSRHFLGPYRIFYLKELE